MSDRTSPNSNHPHPSAVKEPAGAWLFRHRTALPLPLAAAILLIPAGNDAVASSAGVAITLLGEAIRLWAVHHIGAISRTRSDRLGPLVDTGPFAYVRNPLYVGNVLLWVGFSIAARVWWLAPIAFALLAIEYHFIVRWEERLLAQRIGDPYRDYMTRVPRWIPKSNHRDQPARTEPEIPANSAGSAVAFSWPETLFSERGTLIAMAAGYLLLWLKVRF